MEIIKPNNHNYNYLGDASIGIADLPVRVATDPHLGRTITSAWQPSRDELAALMNGGSVELTVFGSGQPPVMLSVAPVNLDLFRETPLVGVIGYAQKWEGIHDATVNCEPVYTFDREQHCAAARFTPDGWRKVGEPFPVSQAFAFDVYTERMRDQAKSAEGYRDAFYQLAELLGIVAQPVSPKEVWETQMFPQLQELLQLSQSRPVNWQAEEMTPEDVACPILALAPAEYTYWEKRVWRRGVCDMESRGEVARAVGESLSKMEQGGN